MSIKPINQRYNESVILDGAGNGSVEITVRADFVLQRTRWVVQGGTGTNQATAENFIDNQPFEGTYSGDNDQSGTPRLLTPNNTVSCTWTGGRPGGTASLFLWGVEYPAGQGIPPPASGQGPGNPIVGGQTLIRNAIQSADFVTGSAGWAIFRDGSYEFGPGGTFRGNLEVDGSDGSKVLIEAAGGHAEIDLTPPTYTDPTILNIPAEINAGSNGVGNGSFGTLDLRSPNPLKPPLTTDTALMSLQSSTLDGSSGSTILMQAAVILLGTGGSQFKANGITFDPLVGLWIAGGTVSASLAGVTSATEVVQITALDKNFNPITYAQGRLYRVVVMASVQTTAVATAPVFSVRKISGGTRLKFYRAGPTVAAFPYGVHFECIFQVPANISAAPVLTLSGNAGQTVTLVASADNNAQIDIYDAGLASNYSAAYLANIPSLV